MTSWAGRNFQIGIAVIVILLTAVTINYWFNTSKQKVRRPQQKKIVPSVTIRPSLAPSITTKTEEKYNKQKNIRATMFWVGEKATEENDYIPNESSAWDKNWLEHFGGIDTPYARKGYNPKAFTPKENPFYVALPYNDFDYVGRKANASQIPWYYTSIAENASFVKNRWIKILYRNRVCYGQWEDVGPFETDDFSYVFLGEKPKEKRAGIDISPALRTCLKMATNDNVDWQFVDEENVPDGPWKEIITTSQVNWE